MSFLQKLFLIQEKNNSLLCVGLDPDISRIPEWANWVVYFLKNIIDETHDLVCCYKPQIAYFSGYGGESDLIEIIKYIHTNYPDIPVILDAKRGDIGSTADQYAREIFDRYGADAITVNPYMWGDTIEPYLSYEGKWVIVLCKTSNPGSGDFENLELQNGRKLYEEVAKRAWEDWSKKWEVLLVVWGTYPDEIARVRNIVWDDMVFLIPGIWAQWGDIEATVKVAKNSQWAGMIINSARAVLYPQIGTSRDEAVRTRDIINHHR